MRRNAFLATALLACAGCSATTGFGWLERAGSRPLGIEDGTWRGRLARMRDRNWLDLKGEPGPGGQGMEFLGKAILYLPGFALDTVVGPFVLLIEGWFGLLYGRWGFPLFKRFFCFYPAYFGPKRGRHRSALFPDAGGRT